MSLARNVTSSVSKVLRRQLYPPGGGFGSREVRKQCRGTMQGAIPGPPGAPGAPNISEEELQELARQVTSLCVWHVVCTWRAVNHPLNATPRPDACLYLCACVRACTCVYTRARQMDEFKASDPEGFEKLMAATMAAQSMGGTSPEEALKSLESALQAEQAQRIDSDGLGECIAISVQTFSLAPALTHARGVRSPSRCALPRAQNSRGSAASERTAR